MADERNAGRLKGLAGSLSFFKNMKKTDKFLLLLGAGILAVVLSWPSEEKTPDQPETGKAEEVTLYEENYETQMEQRLAEILSKVEGAGTVEVMVTLRSSEEKIVQEDTVYSSKNTDETDSSSGRRKQEEISREKNTFTDGKEEPYVRKELVPEVEGILILAEGADRASVKAELMEAIQALFPLEAHKIKVLKRGS